MSSSATPVTVTVCGVLQLALVKVMAALTVAAPVSLLLGVIVTLPVGCVFLEAMF
jgi:hypothetical protein